MSQKVDDKQSLRSHIETRPNVRPPEISELSPDDPVGITSDDTGKPPEAPPPPTPVS